MTIVPHDGRHASIIPYEQRLNADFEWALREGSMHFENQSAVHKTIERLAKNLDEAGIPYALAGGMALFFHGYRRFTEDVDLVVRPEGLAVIHEQLAGRGYLPVFPGSKNLRDTQSGVRIEFLLTGGYPGDGKPKPIRFPDPQEAGEKIAGVRCLKLATLIELKLASGAVPGRRRDLADVQELIKTLKLPRSFGEALDASVRSLYDELWMEVEDVPPP